MIYRQDKKQNIKKIFFVGVIIFVLVYVILFTRVFGVISEGVNFIAVPIWKVQDVASGTWSNIRVGFMTKKNLKDENKLLREDLEIAGAKLLDRNLLYEENLELKESLGRNIAGMSVFATVLTKPNRTLYDTIVIDVGKNAGVEKGDRVLYGDNVVIGKVVEVFSRSAKVLLLSSPKEEIDVVVGSGNVSTVAYGRGGGNFELKLPRDANVLIGDVISVPGIFTRILGAVEYIESKPSDPFKTVIFKGPINIFKLKWVEVVAGDA